MFLLLSFFFFKQKTAYEMRISDWSSDVCSSDLSTLAFDVERVRKDFPVLAEHVHGKPLVYLDSGASAQKPTAVLEAMDEVYRTGYANVQIGRASCRERVCQYV